MSSIDLRFLHAWPNVIAPLAQRLDDLRRDGCRQGNAEDHEGLV